MNIGYSGACYVYILQCDDGSLYTGYTKNIERRVREHRLGKGGRYTRSKLPIKLVYYEVLNDQGKALKREKELKRMRKYDKVRLIVDFMLK